MKNEFIKIILDFAEGRMTAEDFWKLFQENQVLQREIIEDLDKNKLPDACFDPIAFLNKGVNLQSYGATSNLHGIAQVILEDNNIACTPTEFYSKRNRFLIKIQPDWLDLKASNEPFLIQLVESAPKGLTEAQKLNWCKDELKKLFKYDSKPPRWVQHAEWPIINGKPLVFRSQSKERIESELVKFFFYDPETGEETVVEQYY